MKNIVVIALLSVSGLVYSQQESQFASAFQNPYIYNAAAGGMSNVTQIDLVSRFQWVGMSQSPTTINLTGHTVLNIGSSTSKHEYNPKKKPLYPRPDVIAGGVKHVVGGKVLSDNVGVFNRLGVYGSYAFHMPLTSDFNIGAGLGLGWSNFKINQSKVVLFDQNDDIYNLALANSSQQNFLDANAGIVLYGKGLFFGASMTQMFKNKVRFDDVETGSNYNRHFYFNLSYGLKLGESVLEPGVIVKLSENTPANLDFGARFIYKNASWIGVYGRTNSNVIFQLGTTLVENLYVSYAYELGTGLLRNASSGTHEIQLGIYLGKKKSKKYSSATDSEESK